MFLIFKTQRLCILLILCFCGNNLLSQINSDFNKKENNESKFKNKIDGYYLNADNLNLPKVDSDFKYTYLNIKLQDFINANISRPESYRLIAKNYADKRQFKQALINYNYAAILYENLNNQEELAEIYNSIGIIYGKIYNYDKALIYIHKSISILVKVGDPKKISKSLNNLGVIYRGLKDIQKSQIIFQKSLYFARKSGDKTAIASSLNNIALNYIQNQKYKDALKFQLEVISIYEKFKNKQRLCSSYISVGIIYKKLNYNKVAVRYFEKSIQLANELKDEYLLTFALQNIGSVYLSINNYKKAIVYLKQSEVVANKIQDLGCIKGINEVLSEYYAKTNNYILAYEHHKKFKSFNDSIYNKESNDRFIDLQVKYEVEEKDNENKILKQESTIQLLAIQKQTYLRNTFIAVSILITFVVLFVFYRFMLKKKANKILSEKNQQISLQKNYLEEAYATKDKLFAIITHDLKNPFGSLVSLCSFLENNYYKIEDDHKYKGIASLNRSIVEIYYLLENLTDWINSKGNNTLIEKSKFDLNGTIISVMKLYQTVADQKSIDIQMHVEPNTFVYGDERMIKTVLRNVIDNATKFTPIFGKIDIRVKDENNKIIVSVSDTGIGIKEINKKRLFNIESHFSTKGTQFETGGGLGLILSKEFIEKNDGKIWFESEAGKGSTFYFSIIKNVLDGKN